jgi:hypothetical protein
MLSYSVFYYFLRHYLIFMLYLFLRPTQVIFVFMLSYTTRFLDKNDHGESSRETFQIEGPKIFAFNLLYKYLDLMN